MTGEPVAAAGARPGAAQAEAVHGRDLDAVAGRLLGTGERPGIFEAGAGILHLPLLDEEPGLEKRPARTRRIARGAAT